MFLPPRGPLRVYATVTFFDSLVPGIMLAGGVLFFTKVAHLGAVQVGSGLSLAALVGLAAAVPAGRLGDRIGHRRLLIVISLLRALVLGAYQLVDGYAAFLVVACLAGLAESAVAPVRQAYLGTITTPENRVRTLAFNRVVRNIGATLSTPALGLALALDSPVAFRALIGAGAVSVLIVALVAVRLPETPAPSAAAGAATTGPRPAPGKRAGVLRDRPYLALALLNGVLIMHMELLEVGMPLWVTGHTRAPDWTTSALLFLNVLVAIGLQMRVGNTVTDVGSAARAMRRGGYCLLAASAVFAATGTLGPLPGALALFAAVTLLTLTELLQSAGSWGLSYDLADAARLGEYQGAWSTGTQLVRSCGPLLVTLALSSLAETGWLVIGLAYAVLAASSVPLARRAHTRTAQAAAQPHPPTSHQPAPAPAPAAGPR
ncbi:MFS transporter [Streptomyces sp. SCL15-4]|uniref:MFS transporter n=1 Tax=Streptomyces sp. SCL15-4 TaxID=2967221 RepID=UPI002966C00B|nr:MFS transporter [Streptomyces sp. SCL15-4]